MGAGGGGHLPSLAVPDASYGPANHCIVLKNIALYFTSGPKFTSSHLPSLPGASYGPGICTETENAIYRRHLQNCIHFGFSTGDQSQVLILSDFSKSCCVLYSSNMYIDSSGTFLCGVLRYLSFIVST